MKKFLFSLHPLLRLRKINENKALHEFAQWVRKKNSIEDEIREIQTSYQQLMRQEDELVSDSEDLVFLDRRIVSDRYYEYLGMRQRDLQKKLEELEQPWEQSREKIVQARKERQVITVLQERHFATYREKIRKWNNQQNTAINQINK